MEKLFVMPYEKLSVSILALLTLKLSMIFFWLAYTTVINGP
ncbi:hypothetical protein MNBD_GAMMA13-1561 [hydrothermal vent metagenome]|uniref:Uncharacterized protein n=1 Tax=hydrothermal vent metagenome TaxID=652676 RepID=A0A3B0YKK7_9ZZZZ